MPQASVKFKQTRSVQFQPPWATLFLLYKDARFLGRKLTDPAGWGDQLVVDSSRWDLSARDE